MREFRAKARFRYTVTGLLLKRDLEFRDRAGIAQNAAPPIRYGSRKKIVVQYRLGFHWSLLYLSVAEIS